MISASTQATKLQACRPTGVIQTTSLPPYRRNTKLQACRHTGIIQTTSSPHHRRNTKLQAYSHTGNKTTTSFFFFLFSFPTPHRRSIKLLACRPTGVKQNNKLRATQATELQACGHAGEIQKRQVYCNTGKTATDLLPHRLATLQKK